MDLGKLEKGDLRAIWLHEAHDFTNWLSIESNLNQLGDEIGIDIKLIKTEADIGRYYVDILAEEENTGKKIIIENQLEMTDHDHLGKIITYASGYDANIIIWIVKEVRDEHKQAIDWLNEHTDEKINFFAVKMELWKINDSPYAPKFQIISKPNNWAKVVKNAGLGGNLTDIKMQQLDFWNQFKEYATDKDTKLRLRKPLPQHWYSISCGMSGLHLELTINTQNNTLGCEIRIRDSKELYQKFYSKKEKIESELGELPEWMELPDKKASRIKLSCNANIANVSQWEEYFKWFKVSAENLLQVVTKYK